MQNKYDDKRVLACTSDNINFDVEQCSHDKALYKAWYQLQDAGPNANVRNRVIWVGLLG